MNLKNLLVSNEVWAGLPKNLEFLKDVVSAIESVLWPVLIVVAVIGSLYAVYLGINMAKAEEAGKRDEAKKHIIAVITAMVITVALILAIQTIIIPNIPVWLNNSESGNSSITLTVYNKLGKDDAYNTKSEIENAISGAIVSQLSTNLTDKGTVTGTQIIYKIRVDGSEKSLTIKYTTSGSVIPD